MAKSKYSAQTHVCPRREAPAPGGQDHRQALVPSCPQEQGSSGCSSYSPPSAVRRSSALGPARSTGKRSKAATCSTLGIWGWGGALEGNRSQLPQGHCRTPRPGHHPPAPGAAPGLGLSLEICRPTGRKGRDRAGRLQGLGRSWDLGCFRQATLWKFWWGGVFVPPAPTCYELEGSCVFSMSPVPRVLRVGTEVALGMAA